MNISDKQLETLIASIVSVLKPDFDKPSEIKMEEIEQRVSQLEDKLQGLGDKIAIRKAVLGR